MKEIQANAEQKRIALIQTPTGFTLAPMHKDEVLSPKEFEDLPEDERKRIEKDTEELQEQLRKMLQELQNGKRKYAIA